MICRKNFSEHVVQKCLLHKMVGTFGTRNLKFSFVRSNTYLGQSSPYEHVDHKFSQF